MTPSEFMVLQSDSELQALQAELLRHFELDQIDAWGRYMSGVPSSIYGAFRAVPLPGQGLEWSLVRGFHWHHVTQCAGVLVHAVGGPGALLELVPSTRPVGLVRRLLSSALPATRIPSVSALGDFDASEKAAQAALDASPPGLLRQRTEALRQVRVDRAIATVLTGASGRQVRTDPVAILSEAQVVSRPDRFGVALQALLAERAASP